jgi:NAD-dependent histone deacetylase SIR2
LRDSDKGRGKPGKGRNRRDKMGNEQSVIDENTPTETLSSRTIEAVGKYIKDGCARRIVVMVASPPSLRTIRNTNNTY